MTGALIQLVAYGQQDLYITGDPQITFFKLTYRRHTNFSVESVTQNFTSTANFGNSVTANISTMGDLINKIFVYVQIPSIPNFINEASGKEDAFKKIAWVRYLGYALIEETSIEISGNIIDKHYGEWLYIWSQVSNTKEKALEKMVGNIPELYNFSNGKNGYELYIPLEFWFCRYIGLSLPIIALATNNIKIHIKFRKLEECLRFGPTHSIEMLDNVIPFESGDIVKQNINNETISGYVLGFDNFEKRLYYIKIQNSSQKNFESNKKIVNQNGYFSYPNPNNREITENINLPFDLHFNNAFLYVNYVYLDNEERGKFIKSNNEYLIEQIQYNQEIGITNNRIKQKLALSNSCKAHYWIAQMDYLVGNGTINDRFNYTSSFDPNNQKSLIKNSELILNGHHRFAKQTSTYFNLIQPFYHHKKIPNLGILVYTFALNPEDYQPSSSINATRIDNIQMDIQLHNIINQQNPGKIRSYTISYNILRIFLNTAVLVF